MKRSKKKKVKNKMKLSNDLCPKCGKRGSHFVPPGFGDSGFFICESKAEPALRGKILTKEMVKEARESLEADTEQSFKDFKKARSFSQQEADKIVFD